MMVPITYPGVKPGEERLRLNVTRGHSREDMDRALDLLDRLRQAIQRAVGRRTRPDGRHGLTERARDPLAEILLATSVLLGAGASFGLAVWEAVQGSALVLYLAENDRAAVAFGALLPSVLAGAWFVLGGAFLIARGADAGARSESFVTWAQRCQPLLWSALLPPLWQWQPWVTQPLGFLGLLALIAFGLRPSLARALSSVSVSRPRLSLHFPASKHAPLAIVLVAAAAYCAYFGHYSVQNHHNLRTNSYDLGIFDNILWNTADRHSLSLPASPYGGPERATSASTRR